MFDIVRGEENSLAIRYRNPWGQTAEVSDSIFTDMFDQAAFATIPRRARP